jgi:hypothetical protein
MPLSPQVSQCDDCVFGTGAEDGEAGRIQTGAMLAGRKLRLVAEPEVRESVTKN